MDAAVKNAQETEQRKREWESIIKDRSGQIKMWIPPIKILLDREIPIYAYFNNHYAGYAPGSVELFWKMFNANL
jgi:uncharacterized protein YecE (DUF72 family)